MSMFELESGPRNINGGAIRYQITQLPPRTGAVGGTRPGVSGATAANVIFIWDEDTLHWLPSMSYFSIRAHFVNPNSGSPIALARTAGIGYCDAWPAALFSQIQYFLDSNTVENLQYPPQVEAAQMYSSVDNTWLKSFGSAQGAGEALTTRILNSSQFGTAGAGASNYNEIVATWRPPLSIFDVPSALPPRAQHNITFTWAANAELQMVEALSAVTTASNFNVIIDEFLFYKANVVPDASIPLPMNGYIELNPIQVNLYVINGGNVLNQGVPIPPTTTRILVGCQDGNSANSLQHGNSVKPITSFAAAFSNGATDQSAYLSNFYINFPELGFSFPQPQYTFTAGSAAGSKSDWHRGYADFIQYCRGCSGGTEGSVPMGTFDFGIGSFVVAPLASTPGATVGDPNNPQQAWLATVSGSAVSLTQANQTAAWGWLGRCPGPILAVPVLRQPDRFVSNAQIYLTLSSTATQVNVFVFSSFTKGLMVESDGAGKYHYTLVDGL